MSLNKDVPSNSTPLIHSLAIADFPTFYRLRSRSRDRVVEEEEEDRESVASERSDDSLSTKSSRIAGNIILNKTG